MSMDHRMIFVGIFLIGLIVVCGGFVLTEAMRLISEAQEQKPIDQNRINLLTTKAIVILVVTLVGCGIIGLMTVGFANNIKNNIDKQHSESISSR